MYIFVKTLNILILILNIEHERAEYLYDYKNKLYLHTYCLSLKGLKYSQYRTYL